MRRIPLQKRGKKVAARTAGGRWGTLVAALVISIAAGAHASDWYVDGSAAPGGTGLFENPFNTIQQGLNAAWSDDNVMVRGGTYTLSSTLNFPRSGTDSQRILLTAYEGETVLVERSPPSDVRLIYTLGVSYITVEGIIFDGNYGTENGLVRVDSASHHVTFRDCEVRRQGNHMLRLDGDDILVEDCIIHHAISPNLVSDGLADAHCTMSPRGLRHTFRRCDIYMASGDLWQGETDAQWGDIVFDGCDLHFEQADADAASASTHIVVGQNITENCLDTKDDGTHTNYNVTVKDGVVRNSRYSRTTPAALNLKRNCSGFLLSGNLMYNNGVVFRLRYPSTDYLIYNNVIYDNDEIFRLEDGINGLWIYNNTIYECDRLEYDAGAAPGSPLVWKNNIFADANSCDWHGTYEYNLFWNVPGGWPSGSGNIIANPQFVHATSYDLHLTVGSPAVDAGTTVAEVTEDYQGISRPRGAAYDIGAYERSPGDMDDDGDVDLDDYVLFAAAMSGPTAPTAEPDADLDGDNDCDLADFAVFADHFTGPL